MKRTGKPDNTIKDLAFGFGLMLWLVILFAVLCYAYGYFENEYLLPKDPHKCDKHAPKNGAPVRKSRS